MNDELSKALVEIINSTKDVVDGGMAFLGQQIPDVIQQLLMWKMVQAGGLAVLFLVAGLASIKIVVWAIKKSKREKGEAKEGRYAYYDDTWLVPVYMIAPFSGVVSFVLATVNLFTALQIWIAPKVYLIEYAASMAGVK